MIQEVKLNRPQAEFVKSTSRETFMIGGLGMGKSFAIAVLLLTRYLTNKGAVVLLAAPTIKTLRSSTLRQVQGALSRMGVEEGAHYVINRRPPIGWGVRPYSTLSSNKIMTTIWGSYVILDGLENYESQRGTEFDAIFIDEFRDVNPLAREVLLGRLRGNWSKVNGVKQQAFYTTTPPNNPFTIQTLINTKGLDLNVIWGTSFDNQANLPPGYLEALSAGYDEMTFKREVLGELVFVNESVFFYAFDRQEHIGATEYNPRVPIVLSFDFNVDPMTCIAAQSVGANVQVLKEWFGRNVDIYRFLAEIKAWLPRGAKVEITGDATGQARQLLQRNNAPAYFIILSELKLNSDALRLTKSNPEHRDSVTVCNSLISKHLNLTIDSSCTELIKDLQTVRYVNDKIVPGAKERGHLLDCFRYYLHNYHGSKLVKRNG